MHTSWFMHPRPRLHPSPVTVDRSILPQFYGAIAAFPAGIKPTVGLARVRYDGIYTGP